MASPDDRPFRIDEALRFGWTTTRANLKPFIILGLIGGFLALLNQGLTGPGANQGLRPLLSLAVQVLQAAVTMAYIRYALLAVDGQPVEPSRLRDLPPDFLTFLLTGLIYGLIVAGGLVLLIVPGVIWAAQFGFAVILVVERRVDPLEALRQSSRLTRGVKSQVVLFGLAVLGLNLLGAMALGVGLLLTVPITWIAAVHVLRRLEERAARAQPVGPQPGSPPFRARRRRGSHCPRPESLQYPPPIAHCAQAPGYGS